MSPSEPMERFSEFLVTRGLLAPGEAEALRSDPAAQPPWFGTLAFLMGFLDREAIDRVLRHQRNSGLRFGEQAFRMGLLTKEQVGTVVGIQEDRQVLFPEVAALLDRVPGEEAGKELRAFLRR